MVDTGASGYGRADVRLVELLGLQDAGTASNSDGVNSTSIAVVKIDSLRLGGLMRENVEVMSRDYNRRAPQSGKLLMGIIGQEFFDDRLLKIDYAARNILPCTDFLTENDEYVLRYEQWFSVPIKLGGVSAEAYVDTGSSLQMHLPLQWAERLGVQELTPAGEGRRANTVFELYAGVIPVPVEIAGHILTDVEARFSELTNDINIGGGLLSREQFILAIDQSNHLIQFQLRDSPAN